MNYYSTNNKNLKVSFKDAVLKGLAEDGGLFMPESIPELNKNFIQNLNTFSFQEMAFTIAKNFIDDEIEEDQLEKIIYDSINFDAPLVKLDENFFILELFHGPSLAFKDFGARFMARVFSHFNKDNYKELVILVATSGDTGSAVANGFYEAEGIKVVILYPSGKISDIQEKQITTLGKNIIALEIEGTFDDCQHLVKKAFVDTELKTKMNLSSANSINIARLIPQSFYYVNAIKQLGVTNKKIVFSVPSGNFGNLTAGLFAKKMGLNIERFIAAVNRNNVFTEYIETGKLEPRPSVKTLSNAMDVGNPSNFSRILELYENNHDQIKKDIYSKSFNDEQTILAIKEVYKNFNYIIDPHGAVGYLAVKEFAKDYGNEFNIIILETAHPAKFSETIENILGIDIKTPERLKKYQSREKHSIKISNEYDKLKDYLITVE